MLPTPPPSQVTTPDEHHSYCEESSISLSTTFFPRDNDPFPADLTLVSTDGVFFSVHRYRMLKSLNAFGGLLLDETCTVAVPLSSDVLNLILHVCIYDLDPSSYMPSLPLISETLRCIPLYGLTLEAPLTPGKALHSIIVNNLAIVYPLETFAVLASQGLDSLVVEVSKYLTSIPLHQLTDELCTLMGPVYLRRVVFLHVGRVERLKELLRVVPATHDRTILCGATDQQSIQRAWLDIAARLTWELSASTPILRLQQAFQPLADSTICTNCKDALRSRLRQLILDWTSVKNTI